MFKISFRFLGFLISSLIFINVSAQQLPVRYDFVTWTSKTIGPSDILSIYQESDFSIIQSHEAKYEADFIPSNYYSYDLSGEFSGNKYVSQYSLGDRKVMVKRRTNPAYKDGIVLEQTDHGRFQYKVKFDSLQVKLSKFKNDTTVRGLPTQMASLEIKLDYQVLDENDSVRKHYTQTAHHKIWATPKYPLAAITPKLIGYFHAPNFTLEIADCETDFNPLFMLDDTIYNAIRPALEKVGMVVQMDSRYEIENKTKDKTFDKRGISVTVTHGKYEKIDTEMRRLILNHVGPIGKINFDPADYPVVSYDEYKDIKAVKDLAKGGRKENISSGNFNFEAGKMDFSGPAYFTIGKSLALHFQVQDDKGQQIDLAMHSFNTGIRPSGEIDFVGKRPYSIMKILRSTAKPDFKEKFIVAGTIQSGNDEIFLFNPLQGTLSITKVSDESISGELDLHFNALELSDKSSAKNKINLKGNFTAVKAD